MERATLMAAWAAIMEVLGDPQRYRSAHAYRPTPPRPHYRSGRGMELHRLRKAKRLEPAVFLR